MSIMDPSNSLNCEAPAHKSSTSDFLSTTNEDGSTALHVAVRLNRGEIVKLLLEGNIDTDVEDKAGHTAMYYAALMSHTKIMELLAGTEGNSRVPHDEWEYIQKNGYEKYGKLIAAGGLFPWSLDADVRHANRIMQAAKEGDTKSMNELLAINSDRISCMIEGRTALHVATSAGHTDVVKILLAYPEIVNLTDDNKATALQLASSNGYTEIVLLFIEVGANLEPIDGGESALYLAATNGHTEVVRLLIRAGARIEVVAPPVPKTILNMYQEQLEYLKRISKDHSFIRFGRTTPFHSAAARGHLEVVHVFLSEKVDPLLRDCSQRTIMHSAAESGKESIVRAVLKVDSSLLTSTDDDEETPLHLAAEKGHESIVRMFLTANSDLLTCTNCRWETPLHLASRNHQKGVALILLLASSDKTYVNRQNRFGETALHLAVRNQANIEYVQLLLDAGADPSIRSKIAYTVLLTAVTHE
jgi:uncharacterized protein